MPYISHATLYALHIGAALGGPWAFLALETINAALGSDFNGTVHTPFDVTGLAQITEGLQTAGFDNDAIAAIMGGNVQRLLLASLPEE
jgi:hypothetical protein